MTCIGQCQCIWYSALISWHICCFSAETGCCGTADVESSINNSGDSQNQNLEAGRTVAGDAIPEEGSEADNNQVPESPTSTTQTEYKLPVMYGILIFSESYSYVVNYGQT